MFSFPLFLVDLINENGFLPWVDFKQKFSLENKNYFKWLQIVKSIPKKWKNTIFNDFQENDVIKEQHLFFHARILPLDKLTSKQIYVVMLHKRVIKPTSQEKIIEKIGHFNFNWAEVYQLGRLSAIDAYSRMFHFKNTHNIIYLNEKLFKCGLVNSPLCSYCESENENIAHLFYDCQKSVSLWRELQENLKVFNIELPNITLESAFLGFLNCDFLINHILIIFKISLYTSREKGNCNLNKILNNIKNTKKLECNITFLDHKQKAKNNEKWANLRSL